MRLTIIYFDSTFLKTDTHPPTRPSRPMSLAVFVLAGPIGVGKSSIIQALSPKTLRQKKITVTIQEDVGAWQYYLEKFYENPAAYIFLFQKEVEIYIHNVTKHLEQLQEQCTVDGLDRIAVVERSPLDVLRVFYQLNRPLLENASVYTALYTCMLEYSNRTVWSTATYFLLHCPVEECISRMVKRNRKGEEHIQKEYMEKIASLYENEFSSRIEKYDIATNREMEKVVAEIQRIINEKTIPLAFSFR